MESAAELQAEVGDAPGSVSFVRVWNRRARGDGAVVEAPLTLTHTGPSHSGHSRGRCAGASGRVTLSPRVASACISISISHVAFVLVKRDVLQRWFRAVLFLFSISCCVSGEAPPETRSDMRLVQKLAPT